MSITAFLRLKKYKNSGQSDFRGRCPFRENHLDGGGRQSMFLNIEKNFYHCFSCGYRGKLSKLLVNRLDYPIDSLIENIGELGGEDYEHSAENSLPLPILDFSVPPKFYLDRGISKEVLKKYRVGSSDDIIAMHKIRPGKYTNF